MSSPCESRAAENRAARFQHDLRRIGPSPSRSLPESSPQRSRPLCGVSSCGPCATSVDTKGVTCVSPLRCPFVWDMNPYWCSLRWLFGPSSPRRPVPSASPYFLAPPESIDSTWHDEDYRIKHIGPEAENGIEEGEQYGRHGEARSDDHAASGHPDEAVVEARLHQMMMERV